MPPGIVQAPSLVAPRTGLIASTADRSTVDPEQRWTAGMAWEPATCGTGGVVSLCDDNISKTLEDDNPGEATFRPFGIWEGYRCSTFGPDQDERERRARDLLAVHESRLIESAFWTGTYVDPSADDASAYAENAYLRNEDGLEDLSPGAASSPLVYGLAALEEYLAGCGGRGMIHASIPTVALWYSAQAIRREGNLFYTAFDNIVVPGGGYDGSSPSGEIDDTGETAWAYATGMVELRRGPVRVLGSTPETGIDRRQNSWETRAERLVGITLDPCCRAGVNVNLCSTFCVPEA